jgi:DNA-binding Lrp family transcriptional regulator
MAPREVAMPKAFIMIDVVPGREAALQEAISKIAGVKMVYQVTGEHDMIAFVDAEPYEEFAVVLSTIRHLDGVRDTDSQLVLT